MRIQSRNWSSLAMIAGLLCITFPQPLAASPARSLPRIIQTSQPQAASRSSTAATTAEARAQYTALPLHFEANQGQTDAQVRFLARGDGYTLFLTSREAVLALAGQHSSGEPAHTGSPRVQPPQRTGPTVLRLHFVGANRNIQLSGEDRLRGISTYLVGHSARRPPSVPNFARVVYHNLYPGVDLVYHGQQGRVEYDLRVAPDRPLPPIALEVLGATQALHLQPDGSISLTTNSGLVRLERPVVYQEWNHLRHAVAVGYRLLHPDTIGLTVGGYDRHHALVIDPVLDYSTYLGGSGRNFYFDNNSLSADGDAASAVAVDLSGRVYVTGETVSVDFPVSSAAYSRTLASGNGNAFVTALSPDGQLLYSTYLGGSSAFPDGDTGVAIAVDGSSHAYVTGRTYSADFPTTTGAFARTLGNTNGTAFVSELSADGSRLVYSTFLGGSGGFTGGITGGTTGTGIAVDGSGDAFVTGHTSSPAFPTTTGAFSTTLAGTVDAFVAELGPGGSNLVYSTYLGGAYVTDGAGIALDQAGHAYVTGDTNSPDYPTTDHAIARTLGDGFHVFVTEMSSDGGSLVYSTLLGGRNGASPFGADYGSAIAVDRAGHAFITGSTTSADFPTTTQAYSRTLASPHGGDAFVSELSADGSQLVYSTYLGGNSGDSGTGIALDSGGHAFVTGQTYSPDFPTTTNAYSRTLGSGGNAFVSELSADGSQLVYSTYLGGSTGDSAAGIAVDGTGRAYVTGRTTSADFPTTPGALAPRLLGTHGNAFVSVLSPDGSQLVYSTYLGGRGGSPGGDQANGVAVDSAGNAYICGSTTSADFPTTAGADTERPAGGNGNAFITKVRADGTLVYSTYLGGSGTWGIFTIHGDSATAIAVDAAGHAFVTGWTTSADFPTTTGAFSRTLVGPSNVFVSELSADGRSLVYSTYLGGSGLAAPAPPLALSGDMGLGIALDPAGDAYITGQTASADFPTTPTAFSRTLRDPTGSAAFVSKLSADGSNLLYSTYLGGSGDGPLYAPFDGDAGTGIAVDSTGHAFVVGTTPSIDFPTTASAFSRMPPTRGSRNAFVTEVGPNGDNLIYSTYLGGSADTLGNAIALDGAGHAFVTGQTSSANYPTTINAFSRTIGGTGTGAAPYNAFVTELAADGASLIYSTFLGGSSRPGDYPGSLTYPYGDAGNAIAVDPAGRAYLTGWTNSPDFPTTDDAISRTLAAPSYAANAFVSEMSANGSHLVYSTFLGGQGDRLGDRGNGIALRGPGQVTIAGFTDSPDFPTTAQAESQTLGSPMGNAFITAFSIPQPVEATATPPPSPTTTSTPLATVPAAPPTPPSETPFPMSTATPSGTPYPPSTTRPAAPTATDSAVVPSPTAATTSPPGTSHPTPTATPHARPTTTGAIPARRKPRQRPLKLRVQVPHWSAKGTHVLRTGTVVTASANVPSGTMVTIGAILSRTVMTTMTTVVHPPARRRNPRRTTAGTHEATKTVRPVKRVTQVQRTIVLIRLHDRVRAGRQNWATTRLRITYRVTTAVHATLSIVAQIGSQATTVVLPVLLVPTHFNKTSKHEHR